MDPIGRSPIPTPLLVLGKVALVGSLSFFFLKERFSDSLFYSNVLSTGIGALMGAIGLLLVLPGLASLGRSVAVGLPEQETQLKTRGMYRFTRNPIYLGGFIGCIGSCLFAPHIVNILLALTTIAIHHWIVTREEVFLENRFRQEWIAYTRRVPRYIGMIHRPANAGKPHVCPWWLGYFLISPLRRLFNDPATILGPYVREGMTVLEIGPGMGFFSLPMARFVGSQGRVLCVDVQEKMLQKLRSRAAKAGLSERIVTVRATEDSLCLGAYEGKADFALAFAVVHEIPDTTSLFRQIHGSMKVGALLLVAEPQGHVTDEQFHKTLEIAKQTGFSVERRLDISKSHSALLKK